MSYVYSSLFQNVDNVMMFIDTRWIKLRLYLQSLENTGFIKVRQVSFM